MPAYSQKTADAIAKSGIPMSADYVTDAGRTADVRLNATVCPVNPPGHDWNNGLACRWCSETRTAGEAIVSGLAGRRGGDEESALRLLAAFRADVLAEVAS